MLEAVPTLQLCRGGPLRGRSAARNRGAARDSLAAPCGRLHCGGHFASPNRTDSALPLYPAATGGDACRSISSRALRKSATRRMTLLFFLHHVDVSGRGQMGVTKNRLVYPAWSGICRGSCAARLCAVSRASTSCYRDGRWHVGRPRVRPRNRPVVAPGRCHDCAVATSTRAGRSDLSVVRSAM